ncbi:MAG: molybdopterin-binding protein, partial [Bacillota bacterium]|nr:molybdopterin-binding protein [Bacillota bacterium]
MRKVAIEEAIGLPLAHDITEILPGKAKGRAFQRGHIVTDEDITRLLRLGKKHIYVWDADGHLVHEDDAAVSLARAASGSGVSISEPSQGRVNLKAA